MTELLAPAGDERALRAALAAGADAVYFGLERWSARAFAGNFAGAAAVRAVETAHRHGARAHLAVNTLLKDDEVEPAVAALEAPYLAGLDAVIVSDLSFATTVRERFPGVELHASTQLNTHSSDQLAALARLGFRRAILARELSLQEIAALDGHGLDLEVFVHGALCYGYSGDCLLSSMVGGRSGNRGRCSQSCRMRYRLSSRESHGDQSLTRVLSTSDLAAIGALPGLLSAGVTSFKIEGRMKDAAYVGVTTAVYREALDEARARPDGYVVRAGWMERLEQSFSRSFTTAHLAGRHWEVRSGGRGGHRGVLVGRVERVDDGRGEVVVRLSRPVAAGDVVYLYTSFGQTEPQRVARAALDRLVLTTRERVSPKDRLFRLAAGDIDQLANDLVAGRVLLRPIPLALRVSGAAGEPACLVARALGEGEPVTVMSSVALKPADTAALNDERLRRALGALGGTPYELRELVNDLPVGLFLPVAELKELRRRAVAALDERRVAARRRQQGAGASAMLSPTPGAVADRAAEAPQDAMSRSLVVLRLRPGQTAPPLPREVTSRTTTPAWEAAVCLELSTADPLRAVTTARAAAREAGVSLRCRLPEALFDADGRWLAEVLDLGWDLVYVRGLGALTTLRARAPHAPFALEYPLQGLNAGTAVVTAALAGRPPGAVVVSPELSLDEIGAFSAESRRLAAASFDGVAPVLEALAFGRQQVLAARDQLGRAEGLYEAPGPGDALELRLEDAKGYVFPATADAAGTRLYNARVTNLAAHLDDLRAVGVTGFIVVPGDMDAGERRAFAAGGLPALAPYSSRQRFTTGHLFRGVA